MIRKAGNGEAGCAAIALAIVIAIITVGVTGALMTNIDTSGKGDTRGAANVSDDDTRSTNGTVLFEDDFEDGNYDGWTTNNAIIKADSMGNSNFMMQLHSEEQINGSAFYSAPSWSNYTFEAMIQTGDSFNSSSTLIAWFYGRYSVALDTKNDRIMLGYMTWSDSHAIDGVGSIYMDIRANVTYHLKVIAIGQNVQVYINDIEKFNDVMPGYSVSGGIGFTALYTESGWYKMNIDNVKVTQNNVVPVTSNTLFEDDFEDANSLGWSTNHAYMQNGSLDSGNFMVQLQSDNTSAYPLWNGSAGVTSGLNWNNYQLELSINIVMGWAYVGIYLPTSNCYDVGNCPGYWLYLNPETDHVSMWGQQATHPLSYNTNYNVKISIFNGNISAFIEDNKILSAYSTSLSAGTIGIVAPTLWSEESTCYFDNVKVTQLDASSAPMLSVESDSASYLPGDLVTLTASYMGMNSTKVVFKVDRPDGTALVTQSKIVPAAGSVDFSFLLPSNAQYGDFIVYATTYDGQAQTSFEVIVSNLKIISVNVPDTTRNSTITVTTTIANNDVTSKNFILVVQVIDSNGVPLTPVIQQKTLSSGQTTTYTSSFQLTNALPAGEYSVQSQILTGLPSDGGYALDFMNKIVVVS